MGSVHLSSCELVIAACLISSGITSFLSFAHTFFVLSRNRITTLIASKPIRTERMLGLASVSAERYVLSDAQIYLMYNTVLIKPHSTYEVLR